jgi:hypothetical protein
MARVSGVRTFYGVAMAFTVRAAASVLALVAVMGSAASCSQATGASHKNEGAPTPAAPVASPTRDPDGPWVITKGQTLTDAELDYSLVCASWAFRPALGTSMWDSTNSSMAASTGNKGLMQAVDAITRDIGTTGIPGAVATSEMNRFCAEVWTGKAPRNG